jgi:phage shock protein PspC (stress-responsive transcriptional regulator)
MNCNDAVAALVASLENGTPMTDEQREHIRTCERCRELLDSAKELLDAREPAPPVGMDAALAAAEGEVYRQRVKRIITVVIGVAVIMAAGVSLMLFVPTNGAEPLGFWLYAAGMAALISAGFAIPVLLVIYVLRGSAKRRIYKRLKPGRMLSGVCLGIAERMKWDVFFVRLVFIALLILAGGVGFWFYVALDVAMPVHPDDRQYLLRFRLRRWLNRRSSHATGG